MMWHQVVYVSMSRIVCVRLCARDLKEISRQLPMDPFPRALLSWFYTMGSFKVQGVCARYVACGECSIIIIIKYCIIIIMFRIS